MTSGDPRTVRLLLRLFPAEFRRGYGDEITRFYLDRLARARSRGALAVIRFRARTIIDLLLTAAAERFSTSTTPAPATKRGDHPVSSFLYDIRYAARRLRRTPGFTVAAVAILAVGIGLNAAVFSLVDAALYRPPPFRDPDALVHIYQDSDEGEPTSSSYPAYQEMAATNGIFAGVAASSPSNATWDDDGSPRSASIEFATASYFPVLGIRPALGRWFSAEHDRVGSEMVAVVSNRTWHTAFGADPGVVGSTVRLNNQLVTIIGVGPEGFNGEAGALVTDFWLSISSTPVGGPYQVANLQARTDHWYLVKARLAPGASVQAAQGAMNALAQRLAESYPELNRGRDITVFAFDDVRLHPSEDGALFSTGMALMFVAALVLLLACSNLANLLLVRGLSRGPEMAVREALGAGRGRVVRLMLIEALLLAVLGGGAGLLLAAWTVSFIPVLPIPSLHGFDVTFDHRVAIYGALITLATGLIFGLLPAVRSFRSDVSSALREEGRGRSAGRGAAVLRGGLVVIQVAVSVVLVIGAGLLTRSLANARHVDPGVDVERIAVIGTNLSQAGITEGQGAVAQAILDRMAALPGVESAALTTRLPVQRGGSTTQVVEHYTPPSGTGSVELNFAYVSRDYFRTMGVPVLAGRAFTSEDRPGSRRVMLVSETAARLFWGSPESALTGRVRSQGSQDESAWRDVVGVVGDVKVNDINEAPTPMIYFSAEQAGIGSFMVVARTSGEPAAIAGAMRNALHDVRATLPVTRQGTLSAHLGSSLAELRAAAALLGGFSLLALLLASLGVYAVVSFTVQRRTQELGIRIALGASKSRIMGAVVGQSLVAVGVGLAAGIVVATLATRGLGGILFGVGAMDAGTFVTSAVLLLLAAGTAAFVPARRAMLADPVDALRSQYPRVR